MMTRLSCLALAALTLLGCRATAQQTAGAAAQSGPPSLRELFKDSFLIGAALSPRQFDETDAANAALVKAQFNTISPENVLKWQRVHPRPGEYEFGPSDRYVAFGERNGMVVIGHTLVWHSQVPRWVFEDSAGKPLTRDALLARMRDHIHTVVGRYKGRIRGWDVVNEALEEDGTLRQSPWLRIIGPDYIGKAFEYAREADPGAELYYNDYSLENAAKRAGCVRLVKSLQDAGIRVHGIGTQNHFKLGFPTMAQLDSTITAFAALGVKVHVTELDVDVLPAATTNTGADVSLRAAATPATNPYTAGLPDSVQQRLAQRYEDAFRVYLKHRDVIDRVTLWGVSDGDSWLNGWPVRGRTNYPLLFDRQLRPKPAFDRIVELAKQKPLVP